MKTSDFLRQHNACSSCSRWALSVSKDMADVWDAMIHQGNYEWLLWTATRPGVFPDAVMRKLACRFIRETPIGGGKTVWDLLEDARSRKAVEVSEAYADGKATKNELIAAAQAAYAAYAAYGAGSGAYSAWAAYAAWAACRGYNVNVSSVDAAYAAQARIVAELGNPFRKEMVK